MQTEMQTKDQTKLKDVLAELAKLSEEYKRFREERENLEVMANRLSAESGQLQDASSRLYSERNRLANRRYALQDTVDQSDDELNRIHKEETRIGDVAAHLKAEHEQLQSISHGLRMASIRIREALEWHQDAINRLCGERDRLKTEGEQ